MDYKGSFETSNSIIMFSIRLAFESWTYSNFTENLSIYFHSLMSTEIYAKMVRANQNHFSVVLLKAT